MGDILGLFDFLMGSDINQGFEEYNQTDGAILLDVREKDEFRAGHIEGAKNLPLSAIQKATSTYKNFDTPLFIYCHSGARAGSALRELKKMGYTNVKNIGGIISFKGKIVK